VRRVRDAFPAVEFLRRWNVVIEDPVVPALRRPGLDELVHALDDVLQRTLCRRRVAGAARAALLSGAGGFGGGARVRGGARGAGVGGAVGQRYGDGGLGGRRGGRLHRRRDPDDALWRRAGRILDHGWLLLGLLVERGESAAGRLQLLDEHDGAVAGGEVGAEVQEDHDVEDDAQPQHPVPPIQHCEVELRERPEQGRLATYPATRTTPISVHLNAQSFPQRTTLLHDIFHFPPKYEINLLMES